MSGTVNSTAFYNRKKQTGNYDPPKKVCTNVNDSCPKWITSTPFHVFESRTFLFDDLNQISADDQQKS